MNTAQNIKISWRRVVLLPLWSFFCCCVLVVVFDGCTDFAPPKNQESEWLDIGGILIENLVGDQTITPNGSKDIGIEIGENDMSGEEVGVEVNIDADEDGSPQGEDCDDQNRDVFPNAFELCDGLDNDCDQAVDESHQALGAHCEVGVGECRLIGEQVCAPTLLSTQCSVLRPNMPTDERCDDGLDNDCDGQTDERNNCSPSCVEREEICNSLDDDCDERVDEDEVCGPVCQPSEEICDGLDNNCNGRVDENRVCEMSCVPSIEVCDEIDNDCDLNVDEAVRNGCGLCGPLSPEQCNQVDDDCDGVIDEGLMEGCINCTEEEVCNGADDDCDGQVDESLDQYCLVEIARSEVGTAQGARLGARLLSAVEDLNGDGVLDVFASAPGVNLSQLRSLSAQERLINGQVWAIDGQNGRRLWRVQGRGAFGASLTHGDLNRDGVAELIVGMPKSAQNGVQGGVAIYERGGGSLAVISPSVEAGLGEAVSLLHRPNESILIISEPLFGIGSNESIGRVRALSFSEGWLSPQSRFSVQGQSRGERLGERILVIPDHTNDEVDDLMLTSSPFGLNDRGVVIMDGVLGEYVHHHNPLSPSQSSFGASMIWSTVNGMGEVEYIIGAPKTQRAEGEEGVVYFLNEQGEASDHALDFSIFNGAQGAGHSVASLPYVESSQGAQEGRRGLVFIGARHGTSVWVVQADQDTSTLSISVALTGAQGIGSSLAVTQTKNMDGTYRLFVGESNHQEDRGRVRIFSIR